MATPTKLDIQAVKDAMAKTPGLNYVDAARQVRGVQNAPVVTTPTAPVVPTPIQTPPLVPTPTVQPITNQEVQQGVNAVGGTAEQRRQTRTDITAGQTIAQPTPVEPVSTNQLAPTPTEKTPGITQDAFQQAQAKSEEIKAQNEAAMAQNKQKSDLAREDAALAAQAAIPTDKKGIVNAMVTGASVPVQKTEAYNKAKVTHDLFKKYNRMTSDQLFQNLQQGQIGTELTGLLSQNPNFAIAKQKYEQVQKTNAINSLTQATYNAANGKTTPVVDELAKIESKYSAPPGTNAQAYEQFVTQDPDVVKSGLELKNLATQINTVTKTYNDALKSLKEQYPDMPASALITLMGTRTKDTKELLDSYISAKELAKGDFDLAMKMADGHYNAVSKDIAVQQQEAQQIAQEKRQMQNTLALGQAQFDQKIAQQAQAMNDPTMAISTMIDEYKKLGIPFTRSTQQVISDFQSSGQDLPTYLSGLQKLIQSKPEYKRYQQLQQGQLTDSEKLALQNKYDLAKIGINNQQDIQKLALQYNLKNSSDIQSAKIDLMSKGATADQADSIIRNATGNWKGASEQSLLSAVDGTIIPTRLSETTNPNGGKECAEYVNDITGLGLGSTWDSKKAKIDSSITTPKAGDTAIWIPDPSNKQFAQFGHAGIVTGSDGTNVTIKSSNLQGNGAISTITVPISQITQTGGFANTAIKGTGTTISPTAESWANNILGGKAKLSDLTGKENVALKNEVVKALDQKSGGKAGALEQNTNEALDLINSLINHPGRTTSTGVTGITNPFGYSLPASDSRDFKAEVDRLKALSFLNAIPQMKGMGALTEAEGAKLTASFSKLQELGLSDEAYLEELNRVKSVLEKTKSTLNGGNGGQTQSNTAPATYTPESNPLGLNL